MRRVTSILSRLLVLGPALALAGCGGGVLDPHGPIADSERKILFDSLAIMLALIVPTLLGGAWVAWWFREGNPRAQYRPEFTFSGRIEILVWSVPTLIIVFLGGVIWFGAHQLDPYRPIASKEKTLPVQVVSLDWKWLFIYPDQGVASVNELVIPAGTPVRLEMTSSSVMNTFWVPQLAGMIYTMNGMVTQLHLAADHPGEFEGRSGMFSGDHFAAMHFVVRSVAPDAFSQWVDTAKASGPALDRAAYDALAKPAVPDHASTYRSVDPALFDAITTQAIPASSDPVNPQSTDQQSSATPASATPASTAEK